MSRVDRWVGLGLILLGCVVFTSARSFPDVPGQKLGAAFLPMLVGAGLALCGALLAARGLRTGRGGVVIDAGAPSGQGRAAAESDTLPATERIGPPVLVVVAVAVYIGLSTSLGFLLVAPPCVAVLLRAFGLNWRVSVAWALVATVVVHVAFYKLLRVPLPWGVLKPFY